MKNKGERKEGGEEEERGWGAGRGRKVNTVHISPIRATEHVFEANMPLQGEKFPVAQQVAISLYPRLMYLDFAGETFIIHP